MNGNWAIESLSIFLFFWVDKSKTFNKTDNNHDDDTANLSLKG